MIITISQLSTILFLVCLVLAFFKSLRRKSDVCDKNLEILWSVKAQRVGKAKNTIRHMFVNGSKLKDSIDLYEDTFILGNGMSDDIYIDTSAKRIKLYLNVQRENIYLTVLKGSVSIQNHTFVQNKEEIIKLNDLSKVVVDDIMLQFYRKKVV